MTRTFAALALALTTFLAPAAKADPVVVELFTSQGCSSCPPADAILGELAGRADIIPLALHVDYWDYIGWPDTFAQAAFTERQKRYARAAGARSIFTPHLIVDGAHHVAGAKPMKLADQIRSQMEAPRKVRLSLVSKAQGASVMGTATDPGVGPMQVYLVSYSDSETVPISHGENAGRTITYSHIVRSWETVATWDGTSELSVSLPAAQEGLRRVLIAQSEGHGPIQAALRID